MTIISNNDKNKKCTFLTVVILVIVLLWTITISVSFDFSLPNADAQSTEKYQFVRKWDIREATQQRYELPRAVDVDPAGNVYVSTEHRILKYSPEGRLLLLWGSEGSEDGQFSFIEDITLDTSGRTLYVAESPPSSSTAGDHRVKVFTFATPCPAGTTQITPGVCFVRKWGSGGSGEGQFRNPSGIAISPSNEVYVADGGNYRIQKFSSNGHFITQWGQGQCLISRPEDSSVTCLGLLGARIRGVDASLAPTYLVYISSFNVGVDRNGFVYASDPNARIQKFDSNGMFVSAFGSMCFIEGEAVDPAHLSCRDPDGPSGHLDIGDGQFHILTGMAFDSQGNIYVVEQNDRVQKFDPNGNFITKWGSTCTAIPRDFTPPPYDECIDPDGPNGPLRRGDGQFSVPLDIDVDSSGRVYVADTQNRRIQVFEKSSPPETELLSHTGPDAITTIDSASSSTSTAITFTFRATDRNTGGETLGFLCELHIGDGRPCNVALSPPTSSPGNGTTSSSTSSNRTGGVPTAAELQGTVTFNDLNFRVPTRLTFSVAAVDSTGLRDESPETFTWTVIPAPPDTRIILVKDAGNQDIFVNSKNVPIIGTSSSRIVVPTSTVTFYFRGISGTNSIRGFDCILEPDVLTTGTVKIPATAGARSQIENWCIDYVNVDVNRPPPPREEPAYKTYDELCGTETYRFKVAAVDVFNTRDPTPAQIVFTVPPSCLLTGAEKSTAANSTAAPTAGSTGTSMGQSQDQANFNNLITKDYETQQQCLDDAASNLEAEKITVVQYKGLNARCLDEFRQPAETGSSQPPAEDGTNVQQPEETE
jgi:hypothetical protein